MRTLDGEHCSGTSSNATANRRWEDKQFLLSESQSTSLIPTANCRRDPSHFALTTTLYNRSFRHMEVGNRRVDRFLDQGQENRVIAGFSVLDRWKNLPMTVKDAARFLGVSRQTVYLWVERKQIPHLRVMGRNIRFLISDLEPFRAQFKKEVENGETKQT
jgi:excisionase family DNA binding protein